MSIAIVLTNHDLGEYRRAAAALGAVFFDKMQRLRSAAAGAAADRRRNGTRRGGHIGKYRYRLASHRLRLLKRSEIRLFTVYILGQSLAGSVQSRVARPGEFEERARFRAVVSTRPQARRCDLAQVAHRYVERAQRRV